MEKGDLPGPVRPDLPNPAECFWVKKLNPGQMVLSAFAENLRQIAEPRPLSSVDAIILVQRMGLSLSTADGHDDYNTILDAFEGNPHAALALVKRALPSSGIRVRGSSGRAYAAIWRDAGDAAAPDGQCLRGNAALAILGALLDALQTEKAPTEAGAK